MSSQEQSKKGEVQKVENNPSLFSIKLIQAVEKKKLLPQLFSDLDYNGALAMLYSLGEEDALSYLDKNNKRKSAYIKAKNPSVLFKKYVLENEEACDDLLKFWIDNIIVGKLDQSDYDLTGDSLEEEQYLESYVKTLDKVIRELIKDNNLWRACLATGCLLRTPKILKAFSELELKEFIDQFPEPSEEFLSDIIYKARNLLENELFKIRSNISKLEKQYVTLAEKYHKTTTDLLEFKDFPSINLLKETRSVYKEFKALKKSVIQYREKLPGFNFEEKNEYETLNDLIKLVNEIEAYEDKEDDQNKILVLDILDKARQIHLSGTQEDKSIKSLIEKVDETRKIVETDPDTVKSLLSKEHPISILVDLLEEQIQSEKTVYGELLERLNDYFSPDVCNTLVSALMLDKLTLEKKPKDVDEVEEQVVDDHKGKEAETKDEDSKEPEPIEEEEAENSEDEKIEQPDEKDDHKDIEAEAEEVDSKELEPIEEEEEESSVDEKTTQPDKKTVKVIKDVALQKVVIKSFEEIGSSKELSSLLQTEDTEQNWHHLFWILVVEDDLSGAYWLSRSLAANKKNTLASDWLLAAVQGSRWISSNSDRFVVDLLKYTKKFTPTSDDANLLMGLAAALKPTLIAPFSGLISWLKTSDKYPVFNTLVKIVNDYAKLGMALRTEDILGIAGVDQLEASIIDSVESVQRWIVDASKKRTKLKRASEIWKHLLSEKGSLFSFLKPVINDNRAKVKQVKLHLQDWQQYDYVSEQIRRTNLEVSKHKTSPIVGSPKQHLIRNIDEAKELAIHWCNLVEHEKEIEKRGDWFFEQVTQLRGNIQNILPDILNTLNELTNPIQPAHIVASAKCLGRSVDQMLEALDLRDNSSQVESVATNPWNWISFNSSNLMNSLCRRLLYLPEINLSDDYQPHENDLSNICKTLRDSIAQERSLPIAIKMWIEKQDYRFVEMMISVLDEEDSAELTQLFQNDLNGSKSALNDNVVDTESLIEQALMDGIIAEEKRVEYVADVERFKDSDNLNFHEKMEQLSTVREEMSNNRQSRLDELHKEWKKIQPLLKDSNINKEQKKKVSEFILDKLKTKDTRIVEECLARLNEVIDTGVSFEDSLFKIDIDVDILDEFLKSVPKIERWLTNSKNLQKVEANIKNGDTRANIHFGHLPKKRLEEAAKSISHWRNLKKQNPSSKSNTFDIAMLMLYLGFSLDHSMGDPIRIKDTGLDWLFCQATMSAGDLARPIPQFGSKTKDRYDIICLWERPGADTIAARLRNLRLSLNNVIILYLGRLTERQRKDLIRMSREQTIAMALLDEILTIFLAKERDASNRFQSFLRCSLPYAIVDPYTPFQAGDVPREMFFGRDEMVKELQRMGGSSLIYGGRQLGKSALLRHVQREFHHPDREQFAWVLDIKLVGDPKTMQPTELIWIRLRDCLKDLGIISNRVTTEKPDEIRRYIKKSINEDKQRRIIVLFDEADNFLETDSRENFKEVEAFRTLITDTEYRFKVIFTGLHNVQRFQGIPNQPLAHFGSPICVGPLEPKAAHQLIQLPFEVLGYRFADFGSTILRILSYTNYHPGLIQIFCQELLKRLQNKTIHSSPPFQIEQEDIESVYLLPEVRTRIRERFNWTLALDVHYQAIAWLLILDQMETRDSYAMAYPQGEILKLARDWWPDGFREIASDELRGILDEMCGLGVLVKNSDGHYRLRSPNLVRLMGTEEDVENNLEELLEKKIHLPFDADHHHIPLDSFAQRYSPLSFSQERSLNKQRFGINLVFSSEVLGLSLLEKSLKNFLPTSLSEEEGIFLDLPNEVLTNLTMKKWLEKCNEKYSKYQSIIIYNRLPSIDPNNLDITLREAFDFCQIHQSRKRRLRIYFIFDPQTTWTWFSLPDNTRNEIENTADSIIFSRPWNQIGINQRLAQLDKLHSDEACKDVMDSTGGWHYLLDVLFERCGEHDDIRPFTKEIRAEMLDPESDLRKQFLNFTGIGENDVVKRMLISIGEFGDGEIPVDWVLETAEDELSLKSEDCNLFLEYMSRLHYIQFYGDNVLIDPIIKGALFQV